MSATPRSPQLASARFGQGLVEVKLGREADGRADMAAATATDAKIAADFARYGLPP